MESVNLCDINNLAASSLFNHHFGYGFGEKKNALEIDGQYFFKIGRGHLHDWNDWINTGVVYENINAAIRFYCKIGCPLHVFSACDIGLYKRRLETIIS